MSPRKRSFISVAILAHPIDGREFELSEFLRAVAGPFNPALSVLEATGADAVEARGWSLADQGAFAKGADRHEIGLLLQLDFAVNLLGDVDAAELQLFHSEARRIRPHAVGARERGGNDEFDFVPRSLEAGRMVLGALRIDHLLQAFGKVHDADVVLWIAGSWRRKALRLDDVPLARFRLHALAIKGLADRAGIDSESVEPFEFAFFIPARAAAFAADDHQRMGGGVVWILTPFELDLAFFSFVENLRELRGRFVARDHGLQGVRRRDRPRRECGGTRGNQEFE